MKSVIIACFLFSLAICDVNSKSSKHKVLNKHSPHIQPTFSGSIKRDSSEVILSPSLFAVDKDAPRRPGLICEYRLHSIGNETADEVPFEVKVSDKQTGEGFVALKPGIDLTNCDNKTEFNFQITAYDCGLGINGLGVIIGQRRSHRSSVTVVVEDINLHHPYFPISNYSLEIEGQIEAGQPLVSLVAMDDDCSPQFNKICHYTVIKAEADLFMATTEGILLSRKLIKAFHKPKIYNVSVVAHDCGKEKSDPAIVTITIKPRCIAKWTGFNKRIELVSTLMKAVPIIDKVELNACISSDTIQQIDVTVSLDMSDVNSITGCDRDTYTTADSRRKCANEDKQLLELLPSFAQYNNLIGEFSADSTSKSNLPILKRAVAKNGGRIFDFNGVHQALAVLDDGVSPALDTLKLTSKFAVSFRMFLEGNRSSSEKQTILCKSDSSGLSRQHMSVYVRHCHVMLLVRNEAGASENLSPAEWHWKLSNQENCGGRWYRVLINVNFPNATLFLDGEKKIPFLIADDYPLHSTPYGAKWTVGAAWSGRESKFWQHFPGKLADLVMHVGFLEDPKVMKCVDRCKEGIALKQDSNQDNVTQNYDPQFSLRISTNGSDITALESALSRTVYFNSRQFPATGRRRVTVETRLTCTANATKCPVIDDVGMYVMVVPPPDPTISLTGGGHIARSALDISTKPTTVKLFDDISCLTKVDEDDKTGAFSEGTLDSCVIREHYVMGIGGTFSVHPRKLLSNNKLNIEHRSYGVAIRGIQTLAVYEKILRSVTYYNAQAGDYDERTFSLTCFELNGRFHSNTYKLVMTILKPGIHLAPEVTEEEAEEPLQADAPYPAALVASAYVGQIDLQRAPNEGLRRLTADHKFGRSFDIATPAIIIGICVGLMALLVMAVAMHARSRGDVDEEEQYFDEINNMDIPMEKEINEEDLDWDDSAMTITVNPMEVEAAQENCIGGSADEFSDFDDDVINQPRTSANSGLKWVTKSDDVGCTLREDIPKWNARSKDEF
uniref:Calsyntenin-1-like n=1 Tax=Phallusia mammillata TaxID=59560 RepID=A0A6F9D8V2_9ASCI|nr:calsyntenin-1-like [Phallusia mammillata]